MFDWPPNWIFFFCIVAFLAASTAVRGWRDLGTLVVLSALLIFPIKWIGAAAGFPVLAEDALTWRSRAADDALVFRFEASAALLAAIILGSLVMIAWKRRVARGQAEGAGEG